MPKSQPPIYSTLVTAGLFLLAFGLHAAEAEYSHDVTKWQEVTLPPEADQGARMAWFYAANYSDHEWRVFTENGQISAQLTKEAPEQRTERPRFTPKAGQFHGASAFARVDDGWLVGFNEGEYGAALYWFSRDGKRSYKISDHQVVDFFSLPDDIYAIEGLAHLRVLFASHDQWPAPVGRQVPLHSFLSLLTPCRCAETARC